VVAFSRLVQNCREHFATDARTEWALESTTSELTDEMVHALDGLGFTRLHLGVQSLEDVVRRLSNRREPASEVLRKISKACALGWVVSVDMIYGLPEQSLTGLIHDIQSLADVGVDGFSLYEMQISPRNRRFAERHGLLVEERRFINYFLFQAAAHQLASMGYRKTLFNHFARARDMNLYFTFPKRGEDCVALGTIADGVLGDYHYRHPVYRSYCQSVDETFPGLQAGMRRNAIENRLHPLEVAILSGSFHPALFSEVLGENRAEALLHQWGQSTLVVESAEGLCLTANGSWFAGEMLEQLATRHLPLGDS
jgi:coproporphyrinogen III oxidase-like Fe-S oxidoreductase